MPKWFLFASAVFVSLMLRRILNRHFCLFSQNNSHIVRKIPNRCCLFPVPFHHIVALNKNEKFSNNSKCFFFSTSRPTCLFRTLFSIRMIFILHDYTHTQTRNTNDQTDSAHSPEAHVFKHPLWFLFLCVSSLWLKKLT